MLTNMKQQDRGTRVKMEVKEDTYEKIAYLLDSNGVDMNLFIQALDKCFGEVI